MKILKHVLIGIIALHTVAHASHPNIIVILADDFGWGDTSCNNLDSPIKTPAIDRISKEGIRFTNAHTPSAATIIVQVANGGKQQGLILDPTIAPAEP